MIGLGLLEAVPEADILALADPDDADGDGISGRPNLVWSRGGRPADARALRLEGRAADDPRRRRPRPSPATSASRRRCIRDGWGDCTEAQAACRARAATAAAPGGRTTPVLDLVTFYSRNLAVPARRDLDDPQVLRGQAGCSTRPAAPACHAPKFVTDRLRRPAGAELPADLALHRPAAARHGRGARRPPAGGARRRAASGARAPLWGIGLTETVTGQASFLHDGRARTLLEAILWHGGEAQAARDRVAAAAEGRARGADPLPGVALMRRAALAALLAPRRRAGGWPRPITRRSPSARSSRRSCPASSGWPPRPAALAAAADAACAGRRADRGGAGRGGLRRRLRRLDRRSSTSASARREEDNAGFAHRVLARHQGLDAAHARGDGRGRGPGGRRPGRLRRGLGGGARALRARLAALRPGGARRSRRAATAAGCSWRSPRDLGGDRGADARRAGAIPGPAILTSAGAPDNPVYLAPEESTRALYSALTEALQADIDLRLGRPLGTFERPQPRRAEAWRSGRSLPQRRASRSRRCARYAATVFAPAIGPDEARHASTRAFDAALAAAGRVGAPIDVAVATPQGRVRVEALQSAVRRVQTEVGRATSARRSA